MITEAWVVPVLAAITAAIFEIVRLVLTHFLNRHKAHAEADKTDAEGADFISEAATKAVALMQKQYEQQTALMQRQIDTQATLIVKQGLRITELEQEGHASKSELARMRAQLVGFRLDLTELVRGIGVLDYQITSSGMTPNWKPDERLRYRYQEILKEAPGEVGVGLNRGGA